MPNLFNYVTVIINRWWLDALQIIGATTVGLVVIAVAGITLWYLIRRRLQKDRTEDFDATAQPFTLAAQGWRERCHQLETEIKAAREQSQERQLRIQELEEKHSSLEQDYLNLSRVNLRQQGEIDQLNRKVDDLSQVQDMVKNVLSDLKNSTR